MLLVLKNFALLIFGSSCVVLVPKSSCIVVYGSSCVGITHSSYYYLIPKLKYLSNLAPMCVHWFYLPCYLCFLVVVINLVFPPPILCRFGSEELGNMHLWARPMPWVPSQGLYWNHHGRLQPPWWHMLHNTNCWIGFNSYQSKATMKHIGVPK